MRVLYISDVFYPRVNGVSTSIATFRESLKDLGVTTVLVAPQYSPDDRADASLVRVAARAIPFDPEDRVMRYAELKRQLAQLGREHFDVIHIHTPFAAHYAGVALAKQLKLPVVETYHTFFEEYLHHYVPFLPRAFTAPLARRLSRSQCQEVDALVIPSPQMQQALTQYGITTPSVVLPTGIDLNRFTGGDGARFRARHGIDPKRPVLLHISRVAHEKNIDFIVRMLVHVKHAIPEVLLLIAGEGPAVGHLRALAARLGLSQQIQFVGYLGRDSELLDCYKAGDVFVFASRTETQGLVLLEALGLAVPVVSTAVMGTADVLKDTQGAVVVAEDEQLFAQACVALLRDPSRRAALAAAGPADAARFSAAAMAERLLAFYQTCRARGSRFA
jgi:1,2-diacylglycerol 3-alpha-glucosyltransferase